RFSSGSARTGVELLSALVVYRGAWLESWSSEASDACRSEVSGEVAIPVRQLQRAETFVRGANCVKRCIELLGADPAGSAGVGETADRLRQELLRQPQHHVGKQHREGDGDEEHDIERERSEHRAVERH